MKKLIHKYLDEYFEIVNNKIRRRSTYNRPNFDLPSWLFLRELEKIFALDRKGLKWFIKSWVKKHSKSFPFKDWWTPPKYNVYLPLAKKITARTIGADLVDVQPMGEPNNVLFHMEQTVGMDAGYVYAPYIPVMQTPPVVEWDHPTTDRMASRYANREVNPNLYGEINLVEMDRRRQETLRRWQNAGLLERPQVDPETGHIDLPYDVQPIEQDYFIPNFGN